MHALRYQEPSTLCVTGCLRFVRFFATAQGRRLYLCDYCGEEKWNYEDRRGTAIQTVLVILWGGYAAV